MSNKTRKHIWPVSLVMSIAIVGALAAFLVLATNPGPTTAHGPGDHPNQNWPACADMTDAQRGIHNGIHQNIGSHGTMDPCPTTGNGNGNGTPTVMGDVTISGWSNSANGSENLTITVMNAGALSIDDSFVLVLEDDFVVPHTIAPGLVYFKQTGEPSGGARVYTSVVVDEENDGHAGDDSHTIRIDVPDMDPADDEQSGIPARSFAIVIMKEAGIKNPSEEDDYKVGYQILKGIDIYDTDVTKALVAVSVMAKISVSHDDGGRGKEVTVIGSGFNNGTEAEVFVLDRAPMVAEWWDTLDCAAMAMYDPMNTDDDETNDRDADSDNPYCKMYGMLGDTEEDVVDAAFMGSGRAMCVAVIEEGSSLGTTGVGSDHKFTVNFTVHQDEFNKGNVNYICATDNEAPDNRVSSAAKMFDLTPSITVSPSEVSSGDEVTLKPRDFEDGTASVSLNGEKVPTLETDDSDYVFDMPGGVSGVVQISFDRGGDIKRTTITVNPSNLELSKTEVAPNESIIITGSGFNENVKILVKDIKIDGKSLDVSNAGTQGTGDDRYVQTTSSGEFTATVRVWAMGDDNPTLDDDTYTIKVTDEMEFAGKAKITILEPTVSVMPEMVSPRDFITISGENWPISTADDDHEVKIMVDGRNRSVNIDGNGRFRYEYQLRSNIGIGDEHDVVVEFESDGGSIEEEATFEVHDAGIMLTPTEAAPGQTISLEIEGMPPYTLVDHVNIDGVNRLGGQNLNTDRHGNVMITGVLVPYLDPGFYPVQVMVGEETRVVQLEVLAESDVRGVTSPLPGAVTDLGDSLVRIFHFNSTSKVWTFYDPRPEFEGLNTLTELAAGQPYSILVSENVENVVLNGKTRNLTCVGGDCWNQEVW